MSRQTWRNCGTDPSYATKGSATSLCRSLSVKCVIASRPTVCQSLARHWSCVLALWRLAIVTLQFCQRSRLLRSFSLLWTNDYNWRKLGFTISHFITANVMQKCAMNESYLTVTAEVLSWYTVLWTFSSIPFLSSGSYGTNWQTNAHTTGATLSVALDLQGGSN